MIVREKVIHPPLSYLQQQYSEEAGAGHEGDGNEAELFHEPDRAGNGRRGTYLGLVGEELELVVVDRNGEPDAGECDDEPWVDAEARHHRDQQEHG